MPCAFESRETFPVDMWRRGTGNALYCPDELGGSHDRQKRFSRSEYSTVVQLCLHSYFVRDSFKGNGAEYIFFVYRCEAYFHLVNSM